MAKTGNNGRVARGKWSGKRWLELSQSAPVGSLRAWARAHLESLLLQNYAERSVLARCQQLARFVEWCGERELHYPNEVTRPVLERYQRHLFYYRKANGQPLTVGVQASSLQGLRVYFRWLVREGHLAANPAADLVLPRNRGRVLREPLTVSEVESMLALLDVDDPVQLRDRAIFEVMYSTGLRRSEVSNLSIYDVNAAQGTVLVRGGKGGKDRLVPIGARALHWVERYVEMVRCGWCVDANELRLFLNPDGTAPSANTLTIRTRLLLKRAGIMKAGACHLFRHTMATEMLDRGADIRYVQEMLGHEHLGTTQGYTHVSIAKLKAVHAATHPGAGLRPLSEEAATDTDRTEPGAA